MAIEMKVLAQRRADTATIGCAGPSLACALLLFSCGPGESPMTAVASAIEDVPVPRAAERHDRLPFAASGSGTEMAWLRSDRQAGYIVPGISSEQLLAWYDEHLPAGEPWRTWAWCERPSLLFQRTYYVPGTNRALALLVPRGETASVIIVQPDGTSC